MMVFKLFLVFLNLLFIIHLSTTEGNYVLLNIPNQGSVQGITAKSAWTQDLFIQFLGIPFGETTSGENRYKPPKPKQPWNGILDAVNEKTPCPTAWFARLNYEADIEDCLHLSVYTKNLQGLNPVMVVLHGEMYYDSSPSRQPPYYLMSKDIVLVVPQYRNGVLGFLSTNTTNIPGNAGVWDAVLALEWVQKNIRTFGGDPNQITLVGQSAGAIIAHVISISPNVPQNLFHRLILQSGSALSPTVIRKDHLDYAKALSLILGCNTQHDLEEINSCLLQAPVFKLIEAAGIIAFVDIDGIPDNLGVKLTIHDPLGLLPQKPYELIKSPSTKKYPLMAGVTKHDGVFAVDDDIALMTLSNALQNSTYVKFDLISTFLLRLGVEDFSGGLKSLIRLKLFPQESLMTGDAFELIPDLIDMAGMVIMKGPILQTVQMNYKIQPSKTFLYSFDYQGNYTRFGYGDDKSTSAFYGGVCHNDENIYLFPTPTYASNLNQEDTLMANVMVELWTSFVKYGIPKAPGIPDWKPVSKPEGPYLKINRLCNIGENFIREFFVTTSDEFEGISLLRPQNKDKLGKIPKF